MAIATLTDVHYALSVPTTDVTNDTELTYFLSAAENELDSWLKARGSSIAGLPTPTPACLILAEAFLTVWIFRGVRESPTAVQKFYEMAVRLFNDYAEGNLMYPKVPGMTPMESVSSTTTTGGSGGSVSP